MSSNEQMIDAFEAHFEADWRDPYFDRDRVNWSAAWVAATAKPGPCDMGPICIGCTPRVGNACPGAAMPLPGHISPDDEIDTEGMGL